MAHSPKHLLDMSFDDFKAYCAQRDLPAYRAKQIFEWVYDKGVTDFQSMTNLGKQLRQQLMSDFQILAGTEAGRFVAKDNTAKLLVRWPDQAASECVLLIDGKRRTACISTQVGCPIGCRFCASGASGFERNLTAGEIVEQVYRIRQLCESDVSPLGKPQQPARLSNIVIMGIGEPLLNYDAVVDAIRVINADNGLNIGARKITISTVGLPDKMRQLAKENLQINLAISLHAPTDALRKKLIPAAKSVTISEIVDAARYYFDTTGREVTVEYILISNLNDQIDHAHKLVTLCRRMRCNVNIIRYNPVPDLEYARPTSSATHFFAELLRERGVNAHVRKSKGLDIEAACGQLRRAYTPKDA